MLGLEMLEKYNLAANIIKTWLLKKMIESLNTVTVPDDFKEIMRKEGIQNDKVAELINANPRFLFDVFDENNIIISTLVYPNNEFTVKIGNQATTNSWKTRKESDLWAIETAFEILELKLNEPKSEDLLE
jgi:hypothetical protein